MQTMRIGGFTIAAAVLLVSCSQSSIITFTTPTDPPLKLIEPGWKSSWSPDGRELVYGKGPGAGLARLDVASRQSTEAVTNGKDPAWSPGGSWIAFVREESHNSYMTEEVWVVPAKGGEPRKVVEGGFPSWSKDGQRLFVHSRRSNQILAVNPSLASNSPVVFFEGTPSWYFAVSPDEKQVAFGAVGRLEIRDRVNGDTVATLPTPTERGLLPAWSPDGRWVAFGGFDDSQLGLWVFEVTTGRSARVSEGNCTMPAWSKDGLWLTFDDRRGARSIWLVGRPYVEQCFNARQ